MHECVVFASGTGSNFVAIDQYLQEKKLTNPIRLLVSDKPDCKAVAYAKSRDIPVYLANYKGRSKDEVERGIIEAIGSPRPRVIALAGFMRLLGPTLIDAFPKAIINLHPSLLPKYPGSHGIAESFASEDKTLGITIHFVDYGMDTGPIIVQESFKRTGLESLETIETQIHGLEHKTYPHVVFSMIQGQQIPRS